MYLLSNILWIYNMAVSKNNKNISIKVSKDSYEYLRLFSKLYQCSMASLCQHMINSCIIEYDSKSEKNPNFCKELGFYINQNYDLRRKY